MIPDKAKRRPSRRRSQKWFGNLASDFHFKPLSPSELAIKHPSAQRWFRAKRRRGIRYRRCHIGEPVAAEREFRSCARVTSSSATRKPRRSGALRR